MKYLFGIVLLGIIIFDMNSCTAIKRRTRGCALIDIKTIENALKGTQVRGVSISIDKSKKSKGLKIDFNKTYDAESNGRGRGRYAYRRIPKCEIKMKKWKDRKPLRSNGCVKYNHQGMEKDFRFCLFTRDQILPFVKDSIRVVVEVDEKVDTIWKMPNYLQISGTKIDFSRNGNTKGKQFAFKIEPIFLDTVKTKIIKVKDDPRIDFELEYIVESKNNIVEEGSSKPDFQLSIPCPPNWDDNAKKEKKKKEKEKKKKICCKTKTSSKL